MPLDQDDLLRGVNWRNLNDLATIHEENIRRLLCRRGGEHGEGASALGTATGKAAVVVFGVGRQTQGVGGGARRFEGSFQRADSVVLRATGAAGQTLRGRNAVR